MHLFVLVCKTFYGIQVQFQILWWLTAHALTPILQGVPDDRLYVRKVYQWLKYLNYAVCLTVRLLKDQ